MQTFIPFGDDWESLKNPDPDRFVPYRAGMPLAGHGKPGGNWSHESSNDAGVRVKQTERIAASGDAVFVHEVAESRREAFTSERRGAMMLAPSTRRSS